MTKTKDTEDITNPECGSLGQVLNVCNLICETEKTQFGSLFAIQLILWHIECCLHYGYTEYIHSPSPMSLTWSLFIFRYQSVCFRPIPSDTQSVVEYLN